METAQRSTEEWVCSRDAGLSSSVEVEYCDSLDLSRS